MRSFVHCGVVFPETLVVRIAIVDPLCGALCHSLQEIGFHGAKGRVSKLIGVGEHVGGCLGMACGWLGTVKWT